MKKKILNMIIGLGLISTLFGGCSTRYNRVQPHNTIENDFLVVAGSGRSAYGFIHKNYQNSTYGIIQQAANFALLRDKQYFAISSPSSVSNTNGSLVNTAQGFIKQCGASIGEVFSGGLDNCKIHGSSRGHEAFLTIKIFNEQQNDFLVYDAKEVVAYLKNNDLYDDDAPELRIMKAK